MTTEQQLRTEIVNAITHLHALRDEGRLKIHLASMDARDAWERLQPTLIEAERAAEDASKSALDAIETAAQTLSDLLGAL